MQSMTATKPSIIPTSEVNHIVNRDPTPAERLIVALDFNNTRDALKLVEELEGTVSFFKVGLELFVATGLGAVQVLQSRGHKVFFDLKLDDVVETITRAVRQIATLNVDLLTIHGNGATAKAAVDGRGGNTLPKILSVTLLTSLDKHDLRDLGLVDVANAKFKDLEEYVEYRAAAALKHGCDGLITSGQNVRSLREKFYDQKPILICPGIRPAGSSHDDHKRACTPYDAVKDGADFIVVGRPIRNSENPAETAKRIIADIERGISDRQY